MFSLQRLHECLRLLQIRRVKAFGEPAVDWCEQVVGFGALALLLLQSLRLHEGAASRPASRPRPRRPRPGAGGDHRDTLTRAACCRPNRAKALTLPRGLCTLSPCDDAARAGLRR
jgi:hypothetical protein